MTAPLVSIIIPCYNAAPWLAQTLESVLAQTWSPVEIIVVDDGSTDESAVVARRFESRGVKFATIVNAGAATARNHGLTLAQGDFFQFLDADDLLAPEKLERQLARLVPAGPATVATSAWARFRDDPAAAVFQTDALSQDHAPIDWLVTSWQQHIMMATAAWLVPRSLALRAGPWNASIRPNPVDDMEYFSRVVLAAEQVLHCPDARVFYRSNLTGSLSQQRSDAAWRAIFASFQTTADRLIARESSPRTHLAVATALQHLVYESYPRVAVERAAAEARIRLLGGCDLQPDTGPWRRRLQTVLGWKTVKRLHDFVYRG